MNHPPYVVLLPGGPGNTTEKHLVVHVTEYVAVMLNEKPEYNFASEHDDYDSASIKRNQLNSQGATWASPISTDTQPDEAEPLEPSTEMVA